MAKKRIFKGDNLRGKRITPYKEEPIYSEIFDVNDFEVFLSYDPISWEQVEEAESLITGEKSSAIKIVAGDTKAEIREEFSETKNWKNCVFRIKFRVDDWNKLVDTHGATLGIRDSAGEIGYIRFANLTGYEEHDNEIATMFFADDDFVGDTVDMENIKWIYLKAQASAGNQLTVEFFDLEVYQCVEKEGIVSIMFDDGDESVINHAIDIMETNGLVGTNCLPRDVDPSDFDLKGWDIVNHGHAIYDMTDNERLEEIKEQKKWSLQNLSVKEQIYINPNGYTDEQFIENLRKYYSAGRTTTRGSQGPNAFDQFRIHGISYNSDSDTVESFCARVLDGYEKGYWIIAIFHRFTTGTPSSGTEINTSDFEEICEFLAKMPIKLMSEVITSDNSGRYGENIVENGDMELDSDWEDFGFEGGETNERSNVQKYRGTYSRHIIANESGEGASSQNFSVVAGKKYRIEGYFYVVSGAANMRRNAARLDFTIPTTKTGEWEYLSVETTATITGAEKVRIETKDAGAEFYADEISVREILT
jgi:hypothetical protein